jgi:aspartate racemase
MKTLGLIGGTGPESTIDYYRQLIAGYRARMDGASPSIIINSVDLKLLLAWMAASELSKVADYLSHEIETLEKAGADFAALTANTAHIVFDQLRERTSLPLVSIVEAACQKVQALGMKSVGLIGTRYTMEASFYVEVFSRSLITLVTPNQTEQAYIHDKYLNELLKDSFLPTTGSGILSIVDSLRERDGVEAVILAGTELPLLLRDESHNGIPLLDTTRIHVDALLDQLVA